MTSKKVPVKALSKAKQAELFRAMTMPLAYGFTPGRTMESVPEKEFKFPAAVIQSVHKERRVEAAYRRKFPDSTPPRPGTRLNGEGYIQALEQAIKDNKPLNFTDAPGAIY